MSVTDTAIEQ